jgi:class 3 adenylate cyclase/DNA polymerase III delta prime subunit
MGSGVACVLFTDLVGSTELMSRLGDAGFDTLRAEHFTGLRQALADAGGTVVKTTGDGLLATFASAVDALSAAVAVQQATDRHGRRAEVPLSIRVGVALGEVVWEDGDVFGTPVVEAARLVDAARPGQILCTALVRAVAGSRAPAPVADAGVLDLKGLPDPVAVCEVAWEPPVDAGALALPPLLTGSGRIFVGRTGELERALRLWKEIATDSGRRLFLLAGEPGVGKTRLATELARTVHNEGAVVLAGRCDEDLGVPYQPFVEALRHYTAHAAVLRPGRFGGELTRLVPELRDRLPGLPEPMQSDPETERYRLFDAIAAWLSAVSSESPVLLVLDDIHWAAKPTVLLLRHVLHSADPLRLLVVLTYRDTDIGRGHPLTEFLADLRREGAGERVPLTGLDRAGVGAYLEAAAGHALPEDSDEEFIHAVWEETEGNPFFVAEVVRHLIETGGLEEREGRWVLTAPVEQIGIPEGVRDVVGRRLSRLPEGTDRILRVAAVAGLEFEPTVVALAAGCGDDELFAALEAGAAARLLSEVLGGSRYRFSHALVRATLYEEISGPRRVSLHRKTAEAIETVHGQDLDDHLPALAHHWSKAAAPTAESDRSVDYATRAGNRALSQLAHDEAASYYIQALELLDAAGTAADDVRRQELLISLGEAQRRAGDAAHRATLLAAAAMAEERGDADALARAALAISRVMVMGSTFGSDAERVAALQAALSAVDDGDSALRARLLAAFALESFEHGADSTRRRELSDEALAMARRLGDPATLASVLLARYYTIRTPLTLDERWANSAELMDLAEQLGDPATRFRAATLRSYCAIEVGDSTAADSAFELGDALARDLGQPTLQWAAENNRVARLIRRGRLGEAEESIRVARDLALATGQPDAEAYYLTQMVFMLREQGRLGELVDAMQGLAEQHPVPVLHAFLAEACTQAGRDAEARAILQQHAAGRLATQPLDFVWMFTMTSWAAAAVHLDETETAAELYRLLSPFAQQVIVAAGIPGGSIAHHLGILAAALGRFEEADAHLAAAAATHERMRLPTWVAHTALERGSLLLRRNQPGDREQAVELLEGALADAVEYGLGGDERRARELLAEAGQ